jgi:hypothetical protein
MMDEGDVGADLPDPLRVLSEEEFECVQFLWDAFDVVETIDADDNFHTAEPLF